MKIVSFSLLSITLIGSFFSAHSQSYPLETVIQRGHEAPIISVNCRKDGKYIVTTGEDNNAILWEAKTGRQLRTFGAHTKTVSDAVFHPNGIQLITVSYDKTALLWDIRTGEILKKYSFDNWINDISLSPDGDSFLIGGGSYEALLVDTETGDVLNKYKVERTQYGVQVGFSNDGKKVITGNDDGKVIIYDRSTARPLDTLRNINSSRCGGCWARFSMNDHELIYISNNGPISIWDLRSGKLTQEIGSDDSRYHSVGSTEKYIIASNEKKIDIWNRQGQLVTSIGQSSGSINRMQAISEKQIVSVGDDQIGRIWDLESGTLAGSLAGYLNRDNDRGLSFSKTSYWHNSINHYLSIRNRSLLSPDESLFIRGHLNNLAFLVDLKTGKVLHTLEGHEKIVVTYVFSHDGQYVFTGSGDRTIKQWSVSSGKLIKTFEGHRDLIFELAISSDGKRLVSGSWDGSAIIWDIQSGTQKRYLSFDNNSPFNISFALSDQYLLVGTLDKSLQLIEIDTGLPAKSYIGHTEITSSFDIREKKFISASQDGRAKIWDISTELQQLKLTGHIGAIYDVAFDSSEKLVATTGEDRTIRIWNAQTGETTCVLNGHEGPVTSVQFMKNDEVLMSSSLDGTTRFWNIKSKEEIASHILFGKHDWLSKNKDGFFDATQQAKKNVFFVRGLQSYDLNQFFEDFYQPDILQKSLSQNNHSSEPLLHEKLREFPPPEIEIISPAYGEKVSQGQIEMLVKATNTGGGIDEVRILHNGKRIISSDRKLLAERKEGESIYQHIPIQLVSGPNILSVSAFSKGRIESEVVNRELYLDGEKPHITCHVVAIGIDEYKNPKLNLNYAREDAQGFIKLIESRGTKLYQDIKIYPIYNREASKEKIFEVLDLVAENCNPQDVFFFYYAGHGSTVDGQFYFIPSDNVRLYDKSKLSSEAMLADDIQVKFSAIPALKQLIVLDACNSGSSTQILASRGAEEEKALAQLSRSSGVHVLAAAGSEQFAAEFDELGHGLFTYVLLEALGGKADGAPKDGKVTIYELKSFIDDQVPEYSIEYKGQPQFPVTYSIGQDFPIVIDD